MGAGVAFDGRSGAPAKIVYRASSLGSCIRALTAARTGHAPMPTPPKMQKIFDAGNQAEDIVVAKLIKAGWKITGQQQEYEIPVTVTPTGHKVVIRGHIDGILTPTETPMGYDPSTAVFDVKSQGESAWDEFARSGFDGGMFPHYRWQCSFYHHATGLPFRFVRCLVDRAADDVDVLDVEVHTPMEESWYLPRQALLDKVLEVEALAAKDELPECPLPLDYPCSYYYTHTVTDADAPPLLLDDQKLIDLVARYAVVCNDLEIAKVEAEEIRAEMGMAVTLLGLTSVKLPGGWRVTNVHRENKRLDSKAVKGAGIDLSPYYTTTESDYTQVVGPKGA